MGTEALDTLSWIFGGDAPREPLELHQVAARAIAIYVIGLAIVRLGKSRLISRATALDVILGFILGSLLSRAITGHASLSGTTVASAALVAAHWSFTALGFHFHWFGTLIKGHAVPVIENGQVRQENLRSSHISTADLLGELRLQGVDRIEDVKRAYKERNGEVSVIKNEQ
jgi:uncharacterized membrane protein YcaP (DUF421 family)